MDIDELRISQSSMRSFHLEIKGNMLPESDVYWVNSIDICLFYGNILIGKMTLDDRVLIPDDDDDGCVEIDYSYDSEFEIENMMGFKSFFEGIMPKANAIVNGQLQGWKDFTAGLNATENGHKLIMSMDLRHMARLRAYITDIKYDGKSINLTVVIQNSGPLSLSFGAATFTLKQGQKLITKLCGEFDIGPGESRQYLDEDVGERLGDSLSGMAILKGESCGDGVSWDNYAIRLFELEVNLDGVFGQ